MKIIEKALTILFPPKFDPIRDWLGPCDGSSDAVINEQGWCGNLRPKKYRDGIDRIRREGI